MKAIVATIGTLIVIFSSACFASDSNHGLELSVDEIAVWKAEVIGVIESFLVLSKPDMSAHITISCKDGSGPLQSVISVVFKDASGKFQSRIFAGSDFYCYGAIDLTDKVVAGEIFNFKLSYSGDQPNVVRSVILENADGSKRIVSKRASTRWVEL